MTSAFKWYLELFFMVKSWKIILCFSVLRIRIRDTGSGAFLTPGSGMGKKVSIRIWDEQPRSYFREREKQFFGLKYLISLMWIRDGIKSDPGFGIKIPDSRHWCFQGDATHICGAGCQLLSGDLATTSQPCHRQMGARRGGPSSQSYKTLQGNSI